MHRPDVDCLPASRPYAASPIHRRAKRSRLVWILLCAISGMSWQGGTISRAEGFRNPPPGAFGLGRSGGRFAHVDDASAAFQNPANLVDLNRPAFAVAPGFVHIRVEHSSALGKAETTDPWKVLPHFFVAMPLPESRVAFGLSVTVPFGLSNEWETDDGLFAPPPAPGAWRYAAPYYSELQTIHVNPSMALSLSESLSLGLGVDAMWSKLSLRQYYPWFMIPGFGGATEGKLGFSGDGIGVGANGAVTWRIDDRQRVALTVRSPIQVEYEGHTELENVPAGFPIPSRADSESSIRFPLILGAGYGIELNDKVRLEASFEWLQFSLFRQLALDFFNAPPGALAPGAARLEIPQNWKDTWTAGIGADWRFAPAWTLRCGYQFYESPVPDSTFSPTIPDANQHAFTVGIQYRRGRHAVEAAYGGILYDDRDIRNNIVNPAYNGHYEMCVHLMALSYQMEF